LSGAVFYLLLQGIDYVLDFDALVVSIAFSFTSIKIPIHGCTSGSFLAWQVAFKFQPEETASTWGMLLPGRCPPTQVLGCDGQEGGKRT